MYGQELIHEVCVCVGGGGLQYVGWSRKKAPQEIEKNSILLVQKNWIFFFSEVKLNSVAETECLYVHTLSKISVCVHVLSVRFHYLWLTIM